MSQVITILRTNDDGSLSANPISLDEWRAVIAADASLTQSEIPETPEIVVAQWTAHPKRKLVLFSWEHGAIHTTYVDDVTLSKTQQIARALKARVRHEEGEFLDDIDLTKRSGCGATTMLIVLTAIIWFVLTR